MPQIFEHKEAIFTKIFYSKDKLHCTVYYSSFLEAYILIYFKLLNHNCWWSNGQAVLSKLGTVFGLKFSFVAPLPHPHPPNRAAGWLYSGDFEVIHGGLAEFSMNV